MPIVINDFEVVSEPPRQEPAAPAPPAEAPITEHQKATALVRRLVRNQERLARVRAH